MTSDPVIYDENGRLRLELPDPPDDERVYPVTGAVLQGFVDQVNELRAERDQLRAAAPARDQILGYCPMGCGPHLFVGAGGYITCSWINCPRPDAASTLLEDRETEHLVTFGPVGFTIRHPLRERIDNALMGCDLHAELDTLDGYPGSGEVRMRENGYGGWEVIPMTTIEACPECRSGKHANCAGWALDQGDEEVDCPCATGGHR